MNKTKITIRGNYDEIIYTLDEHVGKLLHSHPLIFWHGDGWHMKSVRNNEGWPAYEIEFDNEYDSTMFMLRL
jgi:hypothetical protein